MSGYGKSKEDITMNSKNRAKVTPKKVDNRLEANAGDRTDNRTSNHNVQIKRGVGILADYQTTDKALRALKDIGYGMDDVSIIGQDSENLNRSGQTGNDQVQDLQPDDGNHADDGVATGVLSGGAVGGITGLLVGLGTLAIPGVGPIMLAGAAATAIASTAAGGAIGAAAGGLVGGLVGLGIPEDRAKVYDKHLSQGKYLVIIDGTDSDIERAKPILKRQDVQEWNVYEMADQSATTRNSHTTPRDVDQRTIDQHGTNQRAIDQRGVDQRTIDQQAIDQRGVDQRTIEQRGVDQQAIDQRSVDQRGVDQRTIDQRGVDQRGVAGAPSGSL